jgi:hypothetical protein
MSENTSYEALYYADFSSPSSSITSSLFGARTIGNYAQIPNCCHYLCMVLVSRTDWIEGNWRQKFLPEVFVSSNLTVQPT